MLKLPDKDLFKAAINRPRRIKDRRSRKSNDDPSIAEVFYEPGPEDDEFVPPYSAMAKFTKQQRREFLKLHGRAKISLEKREPIRRMSKFDELHTSRQSYFSEATAKYHRMKEQQFKMYYHPHHGSYRYGNGRKLCSVYQKPELLGVSCVAASRDGKDVVVGYGNGDFKLWDRENQIVMTVEPHDRRGRITRVKFFGDPFLRFLACNRGGEIYLFKLRGLKPPVKEFRDEPSEQVIERARQVSHAYARSLRMVGRYEDEAKPSSIEKFKRLEAESEIVDLELEKQMKVKPYPFAVATWECYRFGTERGNEIEALDIDPTETKVITAGQDASIRLYDLKTRKIVSTYYGYNSDCNKTFVRPWNTGTMGGEGHYLRVYAAKFSTSKEQIFITGGLDGIIKVWDVRSQSSCRNIVGPMVCGDTMDSMDNTIAVGQWTKEGRIMLIDMRTDGYRVLKPMNRWHGGGFPYCLRYFKDAIESGGSFKDDLLLVGGSGYLEVVSIREEEILRGFPDEGHIVSIDNHKNLIFTGSTENAFNLHEYFPNIFHGDSDESQEGSEPRVMSKETKEESPEVPHARIKDIKKIKRTKAPEDSLIKQIKRLMAKSCRKTELSKEERGILRGFPDEGHIVSIDNHKNLIFTGSTENAFNLHEYFPNIFHGDSDESQEGSEPRVMSKETKEESPEVPHARIKDIKKIKRTKAPEDSLIKQIKRLMAKSCRKTELSKEERAELTKKPEEDGEISESSLKNVPLTAKKNLKVKSILIDRIADKQMRKMIKKIRKKELNRKDQMAMKRELLRIQGHVVPNDDVSEESFVYL